MRLNVLSRRWFGRLAPVRRWQPSNESKSEANDGSLPGATLVWEITLLRSGAHQPPAVRGTLAALGLRRRMQSVYHKNIREIRAMIFRVRHLVDLRPVPEPLEVVPLRDAPVAAPPN